MNHSIQSDELRVEVSALGAELQSIKDAAGREFLWQGDPKYWKGRAPNLFPYVGRLQEGKYTFNGKEYALGVHGFVRNREMLLTRQAEDTLVFTLTADEETKVQYPFDFDFHVVYQLVGSALTIRYVVENKDKSTMHFGLGGHPGFRLPLEDGLCFEDYRVAFDERCRPQRIGFGDSVLRNGKDAPYPLREERYIPLRHDLFDEDAIILKDVSRGVRLESAKGQRAIHVRYPDMPYVGLWHKPHSDAPFLCVEPWAALPGREGIVEDLAGQSDLLSLEAGGKYENAWSISIQ